MMRLKALLALMQTMTEAEVFDACRPLSDVDICHLVTMSGGKLQHILLRVLRNGD